MSATPTGWRDPRRLILGLGLFVALAAWLMPPDTKSEQVVRLGIDSLPIIAMLSFLLGLIMGFEGAYQFEQFGANRPLTIPGFGEFVGLKSSIFLEVEGAAHYLPAYAGNLDIMTSAALKTGEKIAQLKYQGVAA